MIDTHAHMTDDRMWAEIDTRMDEALSAGVTKIVNINTDRTTLERGLLLRERYPFLYNAGATTPHDVEKEGEENFPFFEKMAREEKLIAIGETGLDAFYTHSPKETQCRFLRKYFHLAKEVKLPVIIHCRDAFEDLFQIADEEYPGLPLLLHCFTGTLQDALKAIDRGWYISFSGIITFKKSGELRAILPHLPLTSILIETDAPYLAPQSKRGELNRPAWVKETALCIAETLELDLNAILTATTGNAESLFRFERCS